MIDTCLRFQELIMFYSGKFLSGSSSFINTVIMDHYG